MKGLRETRTTTRVDPHAYAHDPEGYVRDVLKSRFIWEKQIEIMKALHEPPYKVLVKAGHSVGKTYIAAATVNYWYDSFNPSVGITTAPTARDVIDLLWTEVRLQRQRAGLGDLQPKAPEMRTGDDHYAKGYTARDGTSFQGRHRDRMLFVFDEAIGVDSTFWNTTKTMFKAEHGHAWLVIFNPTDTTSQAYLEEQSGAWKVFSLSSLDHPNIAAELAGEPPPVPNAVGVSQVDEWIVDWCRPIDESERTETDIEWRGEWFRPGPEMEARALGLWPSQGTYGVWSEALWRVCTELRPGESQADKLQIPLDAIPEIGCDVARHGDDDTSFHARWGNASWHHEDVNGWRTTQTTGRLIELAREMAERANVVRRKLKMHEIKPEEVPIKVDDDGIGGAVTDLLLERGFNVIAVRSGTQAFDPTRYPNRRSELWFSTSRKALGGGVWFGRLDKATQHTLKTQALAPRWKLDSAGRRVVEKKDETKEKIGRSPDSMDAVNLAYYESFMWEAPAVLDDVQRGPVKVSRDKGRAKGRGLFGKG